MLDLVSKFSPVTGTVTSVLILRNTSSKHKALHEKYGDVVRVRPDALTFITPGAWKDIYGNRTGKGQLPKDPRTYELPGDKRTDILFCSDADHTRQRKLLSHAFSDAALRSQEYILTQYFELLVTKLFVTIKGPEQGVVDLTHWFNFVTFDIVGDMCFGESFKALETGKYHTWMRNLFDNVKHFRIMSIAAFYQPLFSLLMGLASLFPSFEEAKLSHDKFSADKTRTRLEAKTDRKDFMSYILRHNDERGMSNKEIESTSGLLIVAGSETSSTALTGLFYYLLKHPIVYEKVKEEARNAFQEADDMTLVSTSQLHYLHACLEETMRLYPPVPIALPRVTGPEGAVIDGVVVPGNTIVAVAQYAAYHSPRNFHHAESFIPERWLTNRPEEYQNDKRDVLQPFSVGPRGCIGKNLAYNEMRSIAARMLWHFDMELVDKNQVWTDQPMCLLWEKPPLKVKLSPRVKV